MTQKYLDKNKIEKEERYIKAFGERINQLAWTEDKKSFYEEHNRLLKSYRIVEDQAMKGNNVQFYRGLKDSFLKLEQVKEQYESKQIINRERLASLITISQSLKS